MATELTKKIFSEGDAGENDNETMIVTSDGLVSVPKIDLEFGSKDLAKKKTSDDVEDKSLTEGRISSGKRYFADFEPSPMKNQFPMKFPMAGSESNQRRRPEVRFPHNNNSMKNTFAVQWSENEVK